jgi:hypothetical protein
MGRDLRAYARQTRLRLVLGLLILVILVGDGLIYLIYGPQAAVLGITCQLGLLVPVLLVALILLLLDRLVKHANRN